MVPWVITNTNLLWLHSQYGALNDILTAQHFIWIVLLFLTIRTPKSWTCCYFFSDLILVLQIQHSFPALRNTQCLLFQEFGSPVNNSLVLPAFSYPYLNNLGIISKRLFCWIKSSWNLLKWINFTNKKYFWFIVIPNTCNYFLVQ